MTGKIVKPIKLAILGFGRMGQRFFNYAQSRQNVVEVLSIWKNRPVTTPLLGSTRISNNLEEVIAPADAVMICSSPDKHADHIAECLRMKKPFFCEKPFTRDISDSARLSQNVTEAALPHMIGFNRRFDPSWIRLKRGVLEGVIGDAHSVTVTSRDRYAPSAAYVEASGGIHFDMTIHDIDAACWLLDGQQPVRVYAIGKNLTDLPYSTDVDTCTTLIEFSHGTVVTILNSRRSVYGQDQRAEIFGSKGMAKLDNQYPNYCQFYSEGNQYKDNMVDDWSIRNEKGYEIEFDAFLDLVNGDDRHASFICTAAQAHKATMIADAARKSLQTKMPIDL